ncbi:hypothetical protein EIP86_002596 [Pleurotus ostreatoroseus]|nr:hypothetical protein EIP86_002596 [Pleurotus ostreatoroseus]
MKTAALAFLALFGTTVTSVPAQSTGTGTGKNIVLTNDDGWAVAQVRAQVDALAGAGFNVRPSVVSRSADLDALTLSVPLDDWVQVVLAAPAQDQSGTGSATSTPSPLAVPCEFASCPAGSPAEGFNASDRASRLLSPVRASWLVGSLAHWRRTLLDVYCSAIELRERLPVSAPIPARRACVCAEYLDVDDDSVDSVRFGIQTLAPQFFDGAPPDLVVSGPNVGPAAASASGLPAIAFSGTGTAHEAWTALTDTPTSSTVSAAQGNAALALRLVQALLAASSPSSPLLPAHTFLNVNFPSLNSNASASPPCTPASAAFVLTRVFPLLLPLPVDVDTCGNGGRLPAENDVVTTPGGCFASVSAVDARTKLDAGKGAQAGVLERLGSVLGCLPSS